MYQGELRVIEPVRHHARNDIRLTRRFKTNELGLNDMLVYTYSTKSGGNAAFGFVNSGLQHQTRSSKLNSRLEAASDAQQPSSRRLATQPAVFNGCIGWTNSPYGVMNANCPSVTKEILMGVAHDTGYTKALTGYGTDGSVTESDAIARVEEDAQMNNNLLNVLFGNGCKLASLLLLS